MEKRGVIEEGRTPPEPGKESLEDHVTKRAAEAAKQAAGQHEQEAAKTDR